MLIWEPDASNIDPELSYLIHLATVPDVQPFMKLKKLTCPSVQLDETVNWMTGVHGPIAHILVGLGRAMLNDIVEFSQKLNLVAQTVDTLRRMKPINYHFHHALNNQSIANGEHGNNGQVVVSLVVDVTAAVIGVLWLMPDLVEDLVIQCLAHPHQTMKKKLTALIWENVQDA